MERPVATLRGILAVSGKKKAPRARHDEDNGSVRFRLQRPRMATYRLGDEDSSPAWTL